jgi:hypothetical protein
MESIPYVYIRVWTLNIDALIGFSVQISQFLSYSPSGSIYYRRRSYEDDDKDEHRHNDNNKDRSLQRQKKSPEMEMQKKREIGPLFFYDCLDNFNLTQFDAFWEIAFIAFFFESSNCPDSHKKTKDDVFSKIWLHDQP